MSCSHLLDAASVFNCRWLYYTQGMQRHACRGHRRTSEDIGGHRRAPEDIGFAQRIKMTPSWHANDARSVECVRVRPEMTLQIKLAALREFFAIPAEAPLVPAMEEMLQLMAIPLEGSLAEQVDKLVNSTGIVLARTTPCGSGTGLWKCSPSSEKSPGMAPSALRRPNASVTTPACRLPLPRCLSCQTQPASAPVLFTRLHTDGIGATVDNMFQAVEYASRRRWNYGGAVTPQGSELRSSSHHASHAAALDFFFGRKPLVTPDALHADLPGSSRVTTVETVEALDAMTMPLPPGKHLWLTQTHPRFPWQPPSFAMLAALHAGAACSLARYGRRLRFAPGRRSVAMHLRRGDISPGTQGGIRCKPRQQPGR
jgi:hypothetical protein